MFQCPAWVFHVEISINRTRGTADAQSTHKVPFGLGVFFMFVQPGTSLLYPLHLCCDSLGGIYFWLSCDHNLGPRHSILPQASSTCPLTPGQMSQRGISKMGHIEILSLQYSCRSWNASLQPGNGIKRWYWLLHVYRYDTFFTSSIMNFPAPLMKIYCMWDGPWTYFVKRGQQRGVWFFCNATTTINQKKLPSLCFM
jgi:hypothetical protein